MAVNLTKLPASVLSYTLIAPMVPGGTWRVEFYGVMVTNLGLPDGHCETFWDRSDALDMIGAVRQEAFKLLPQINTMRAALLS